MWGPGSSNSAMVMCGSARGNVKARLTRRDGAEYPTEPHLSKPEIFRSVTGKDSRPTVGGVGRWRQSDVLGLREETIYNLKSF